MSSGFQDKVTSSPSRGMLAPSFGARTTATPAGVSSWNSQCAPWKTRVRTLALMPTALAAAIVTRSGRTRARAGPAGTRAPA